MGGFESFLEKTINYIKCRWPNRWIFYDAGNIFSWHHILPRSFQNSVFMATFLKRGKPVSNSFRVSRFIMAILSGCRRGKLN